MTIFIFLIAYRNSLQIVSDSRLQQFLPIVSNSQWNILGIICMS